MQQLIAGGDSQFSNVATRYHFPNAHNQGTTTATDTGIVIPVAGTLSFWRVAILTAPGVGKSWTFDLLVNGVSQMQIVISGTDTSGEDTSTVVSLVAGDIVRISSTPASTPAALATGWWGMVWDSTHMITCNHLIAGSTTQTRYNFFGGHSTLGWTTTNGDRSCVWPIAATISTLYVALTAAPGAGKSYAISVMVNGSAATGTATVSETDTSAVASGLSITLAAGDVLQTRSVPSGTPASARYMVSAAYTPTVAGEFAMCLTYDLEPAADRFGGINGWNSSAGWAVTESDVQSGATATGAVAFSAKAVYVNLTTGPGAGTSRTFTVSIGGSPSAITATVSNTDTTASGTGLVSIPAATGTLSIKHTESGVTGASAFYRVGTAFQGPTGGRDNLLLLGVS